MKKSILIRQETGIQFVKFSLVGILNTVIHYAVFLLFYKLLCVHYLLSSIIGYAAGLLNSFALNKQWTFKTKGKAVGWEFTKFLLVNAAAFGVNIVSLNIFVEIVNIRPEISQIFALGFLVTVNFLGNKLWTFK